MHDQRRDGGSVKKGALTVNRLSPGTASTVLAETLPRNGNKPFQILTSEDRIRSLHGATYTRLWNMDLLSMIREYATDFQPPQQAVTGGTGLYAGEQDMFVFLIDPLGWVDVEGENYTPGFFVWNSEVGRRALGCRTFWFEQVCRNHIVWDATDVCEYTHKHTSRVHDGLTEIRTMIENIVATFGPYATSSGVVEVSVWRNTHQGPNGERTTMTVSYHRSYKDDAGKWQQTKTLYAADIPPLVLGLQKAYEFILSRPQRGS